MKNLKFDILTMEQIYGSDKLKIFEHDTRAAITDFTILQGGFVSNIDFINDHRNINCRTGSYWTKTIHEEVEWLKGRFVHEVSSSGSDSYWQPFGDDIGVRPVLPYSVIKDSATDITKLNNGILKISYGEYPQNAASKKISDLLEFLYSKDNLSPTGKSYTSNTGNSERLVEYELNNSKYVRIKAKLQRIYYSQLLSNNEEYINGDYVWVEVRPIEWLVDVKNDVALTEKIIFTGVPFSNFEKYNGNFKETNIKYYLDNCFSQDIIPSKTFEQKNSESLNINLQSEERNPEIVDAYIEYKPGINITLKLPSEILDNIDTINIQSLDDDKKQVVYIKKR